MLVAIGALPVLIWIYLLFARGGFWRIRAERASAASVPRRIVAVIPARNEAEMIGRAIQSLARQVSQIIVVNDASTDGTTQAARGAIVLEGKPLSFGWTGKLWALSQGIHYAQALQPDYLLLTDADIEHGSGSVSELVAIAEERHADLASYMVQLACETTAEKALIPAFVFFFLKLYPPKWIASSRLKTAGAAGGCMLIRPEALARIGGIEAIRDQVIDDCALARSIKRSGGQIWMGLTRETRSVRSYGGFREIGRMISRTAFNQLHHSVLLLVAAILGLLLTYVLPPVLLFSARPLAMTLGAIAWLLMSIAYWPMVRFYERAPLWTIALPLIALFYMGATLHSAVRYWTGRGGEWKGRTQDLRAAR